MPSKGIFRAKHGISTNQQMVLFLARLNIKKGLDLLLPAFRKIHQQIPDAQLILAGPDDGYQSETEEFIRANNLEGRVKLVGMLTDTIKKEFPGITYLSDTEYAGATSDTAQQKSASLATRYRGQVDGIFCVNESSTFGMLRALEGAGMLASKR